MKKLIGCLVLSSVAFAAPLGAQGVPSRPQEPAAGKEIPLKVQVVVSRYQGEKKVSSLPYTLSVVANDNDKTSLRMGVDVPIPTSAGPAVTSYTYQKIGTNIDCSARTAEGGLFKLDLAVEDSSLFLKEKESVAGAGLHTVRVFQSTFNILLKDGQTTQHTSATDPVSGEVLRIDVTLNVLK